MKKLLVALAIFTLLTTHTNAQVYWTNNIGATWHFNYNDWSAAGVIKRIYTGDTLINGHQLKVLSDSLYRQGYDFSNGNPPDIVLDTIVPRGKCYLEFTGDSVFHYMPAYNVYPELRYLLYNFGAEVGDEWDLPYDTTSDCPYGRVRVTSKGTETLGGQPVRWIYLTPLDSSNTGIWGKINEYFGPNTFDMFPEYWSSCDSNLIVDEGTCFITCFSDGLVNYSVSPNNPQCNYLLAGVNSNQIVNNNFTLYPNPTNGIFNLQTDYTKPYSISIIDLTGRTVVTENSKTGNIGLNINGLAMGLYAVRISTPEGEVLRKLVIN